MSYWRAALVALSAMSRRGDERRGRGEERAWGGRGPGGVLGGVESPCCCLEGEFFVRVVCVCVCVCVCVFVCMCLA